MRESKISAETDRGETTSHPGLSVRQSFTTAGYPVLSLQRSIGNRAVTGLLAPLSGRETNTYGKIRVSQPGEPAEVEADRVAQRVTRSSEAASSAQDGLREISGHAAENALANLGPGHAMDGSIRPSMEAALGHDFSGVRIHTDSKAAESAQALNARAYTVGSQIVFAAGEYAPGSQSGQRLIAHELTHVAQQGASRPIANSSAQQVQPSTQTSTGKVIHRQPPPPSASSSAQVPAPVPQLTQQLYDQAIAVLAGITTVDQRLLRILRQGRVGTVVPGVQTTSSTTRTPTPPAPAPPSTTAQITVVFDLDISLNQSGLPPGAFAQFVEDPRNLTTITGTAAGGFTFDRILRILTKAPGGANAANDLAFALLHEGNHMLLGMDRTLQQGLGVIPNDSGLTAGLSGKLAAFAQYQQAGRSSTQRPALTAALVTELTRVVAPTGGSGGPNMNALADEAIDTILEERFVFDQQHTQASQFPVVTNAAVAHAYVPVGLASATGNTRWPALPAQSNLDALATAFLNDVQQILNPPPPPSTTTPGSPKASTSAQPVPKKP